MRVDAHTHIGSDPGELGRKCEELLIMLQEYGIDAAVAFAGGQTPKELAKANDYVAEAMKRYPQRIIGFARVNPCHGEVAIRELERAVTQLGLKGLKLHPPSQGFDVGDMAVMRPVLDAVAELDIPVAIHCGLRVHDNPWRIGLVAEAYPDVTVFMLHSNFGGTDRVGTMWVAERAQNVIFETSATAEPSFIKELVAVAGKDRVAYGSDWPALSPRLGLAVVEAAGLADDEFESVMGGSVARLFG